MRPRRISSGTFGIKGEAAPHRNRKAYLDTLDTRLKVLNRTPEVEAWTNLITNLRERLVEEQQRLADSEGLRDEAQADVRADGTPHVELGWEESP